MLRANYTDEKRTKFQQLRYNCPDARIMRRFEIHWLRVCGTFAQEIATIVQQNVRTVRDVINMLLRKLSIQYARPTDCHRLGQRTLPTLQTCRRFGDRAWHHVAVFPSYSPNLNLIERLWKFVKNKWSLQHLLRNLRRLRSRIDSERITAV